MILAAATEPDRGWGGPLAILIAFAVFRVVVMPAGRWVMAKIGNPSPTPALPTAERVKAKATVGVTDDDTPDTPDQEEGWWGRIVERNGHRYRVVRQVMATGSHELPPAEDDEPDEDPEIDLALDGDEQEDDQGQAETVDEFIDRIDTGNVSDGLIASAVMKRYGGSESTARRRIRKVRDNKKEKLQNAG